LAFVYGNRGSSIKTSIIHAVVRSIKGLGGGRGKPRGRMLTGNLETGVDISHPL
jgi:hypothetical protein